MTDVLKQRLEKERQVLLDLTARNRLIHTPLDRSRVSHLRIVDELSDELYRMLVLSGKRMSFLAGAEQEPVEAAAEEAEADDETDHPEAGEALAQPEDESVEEAEQADDPAEGAVAARHVDTRLQTNLLDAKLQKKLLRLFYDARTIEEEQGVNVLFLALGFLQWQDTAAGRPRWAPLLLVPVTLDRTSARSKFRLSYNGEDVTTNLSLKHKLLADFGVALPEVGEEESEADEDGFKPSAYFAKVREVVDSMDGWEVRDDEAVLGFFSFAKLLMYRDLDPALWPKGAQPDAHPLVRGLLQDGFEAESDLLANGTTVDDLIDPAEQTHVVQADSSQALVVEEVRRGRNLVVQGPPGTGKSQTICNLIAAAVREGKTVLFVAEKMAALEVVKRRLEGVGLGAACLELHSNKARKRRVLDDLDETMKLGAPLEPDIESMSGPLREARDRLNGFVGALHAEIGQSGRSAYQVMGRWVQLQAQGWEKLVVTLPGAGDWPAEARDAKRAALSEWVAEQAQLRALPGAHAWRGVGLATVLPTDRAALLDLLPGVREVLDAMAQAADKLATLVGRDAADTLLYAEEMERYSAWWLDAPPMDAEALGAGVWREQAQAVRELVAAGVALTAARGQLQAWLIDAAWTTEVEQARVALASHGGSFFSFLNGGYRRANALLKGLCTRKPPKELGEKLKLLDTLIAGQKAMKTVGIDTAIGAAAFGSHWRQDRSDFAALSAIEQWRARSAELNAPADFAAHFAALPSKEALRESLNQARASRTAAETKFGEVVDVFQLDLPQAFGVQRAERVDLSALRERVQAWQADPEGLSRWVAYRRAEGAAVGAGLDGFVSALNQGELEAAQVLDAFDLACCHGLMMEAHRSTPALGAFDGPTHDRLRRRFAKMDRELIELSRQAAMVEHHEHMPRGGAGVGEMGLLRREIAKKRRHLPIRRLLSEAGRAVQQIKPVFMMSPMSVAQFLEPGGLSFDLLLIDEASQMQPIDALGATQRVKQMVVVGDDKQLPPTRFFDKLGGDDEEDGLEFQTSDLESILGLCAAQGVTSRMLRWHYRSKHDSLIRVSNQAFYGNDLYVIPSPVPRSDELGLRWHKIEGVFDRGGAANNRIEAKAVAEAVMAHFRDRPEESLGVAAFSVQQRDAILDELEALRRADPSLEEHFLPGQPDAFFVKNLENVQGDERDVIFISVGYGPGPDGKMTMNFGPLSNTGGERRLNVLITRAKRRCEVFSSITADDIDLERVSREGPKVLKRYLSFAAGGPLDVAESSGRGLDSVFEAQVAEALQGRGYEVVPQVGDAGFYIDLAVKDPDQPGQFLLGVECDGASYHSSRSARDRDASREAVLRSRGWRIHRVWSTDWFNRPGEELDRLIEAIELTRNGEAEASAKPRAASSDEPVLHRREVEADEVDVVSAPPYEQAELKRLDKRAAHDLSPAEMAQLVLPAIQVEQPVHADEVVQRVKQAYGLKQAGSRLTQAVELGLAFGVQRAAFVVRDGFYRLPGGEVVLRDRSEVASKDLRSAAMLPPMELAAGLEAVVKDHLGVSREDAVRAVSKQLGFKRTGEGVADALGDALELMLADGRLREEGDRLYVAEAG